MKAEIGIWPKDRQILHEILPLDTPLLMDFLVSNICNFKCNYCIQSGTNEEFEKSGFKKQFMDWETFELGVEQVKEFPRKLKMLALLGHGEPTLHKRLPDMIRKIRDADITNKVVCISNGSTLTPEYSQKLVDAGLQELRISLQGLSSKKYFEISKAKIDWNNFYDNISFFSKIKGDCLLKVKIADTALDKGEEELFYSLFGDICDAVDIEHIYDCWAQMGKETSIPIKETQKNRYGHELRKIDVCWWPFGRADFSADGRLTNCCAALFGFEKNIREVSMVEAWNSQEMNKMREDFLKHNISNYPPCLRCHTPEGTFHPEDILDGHEEEILNRMREKGMLTD